MTEAGFLQRWMPDVVGALVSTGRAVPAMEILDESESWHTLTLTDLRGLFSTLRDQGYLQRALRVAAVIDEVTGDDAPSAGSLVEAEVAALQGSLNLTPPAPKARFTPVTGRVLAVSSISLLEAESPQTVRTHRLALAGSRLGVDIAVVTQMGVGGRTAYDVDELEGVAYHRLPGVARGSRPFDEWLTHHTSRLAAVVRKVRPAMLLPSSDFVNGIAARAVGEAYGIPVIYDVRGLFEDGWLRRQREQYGWSDEQVPGAWGMPDVWTLRRERELQIVAESDGVIVASESLRDRLEGLGVDATSLRVVSDPDTDLDGFAELLELVGAVDRGAATLARVTVSVEVAENAIRSSERRPLGTIETFAGSSTVESIRDFGWKHAGLEPVLITSPFDWISACRDHRSQGFHLHAWDFMVPFLKAWHRDRDRDALDWCLARAVDWATTFPDGTNHGTMAWYDMSLGLRAPRLAYLLQEAVHAGVPAEIIEALVASVVLHQKQLFAPQAFNPSTNHGFYTAVGQLSFTKRLAKLPGMEILEEQGQERLRTVTSTQFASDGGHLEHSPDYHRMLLSSFIGAMEDGLLTDAEVADRVARASEVMGWFLRPDRTVVQIGDSPARVALRSDREMAAPHTQFLVREGAIGEPNPQELLVLEKSGYAIVRSPQPVGTDDHRSAGYLTLMAGFHSRTHKHCDDLSVTWFDAGQELLIDAGRYGYLDQLPPDSPQRDEGFFYGRPERQYVERTRAHNTVEADGRDHERKRRAPYGSGIESGAQSDSEFHLLGRVDHGVWTHSRQIRYAPGRWLMIEDQLESTDGKPHDFQVWWNLPGTLPEPATQTNGGIEFSLEGDRTLHIEALNDAELVAPVRGQQDPLRGWRSMVDYDFTPAWSLAHRVTSRTSHTFCTLLELGEVSTKFDVA